jgi:ABC-2 type transport system ATP-binding protein
MSALETISTQPVIDVRGLSKWFGNVVALNDVTLSVNPGVTGLLGPNGAGKTTLLNLMSGLSKPSDGEVIVLGEPVRDNYELYRRIGVLTANETVYPFYTGRQFVEFAAKFYDLPSPADAVDLAIQRVGLSDVQHRNLGAYSRGMRQRMRLASTLVHDPQVLIMDEPLSGTDPQQRVEFQDLIQQLAEEGKTILISSHILEEVEVIAERILLMMSGKLAAAGNYRAIRAKLDERAYQVRIVTDAPRLMAAALVKTDAVESVSIESDDEIVVLSRNVTAFMKSVPKLAQEQQIRLTRVEPLDDSLESTFSYIVER